MATNQASHRSSEDDRSSTRLIAAAAALGAGAVAALLGLALRRRAAAKPSGGEHAVPDLAADAPVPGTNRAPDAFRPDPTAPVPESERDSLRPATGPAPSLVQNRGTLNGATAPANG